MKISILNLYILLIIISGCSTDSTNIPDIEFILTLDKTQSGRAILRTKGPVEVDNLSFMVNDSTFSQKFDMDGNIFYIADFDGLPERRVGAPGIATIHYAESRADITFVWDGRCNPVYNRPSGTFLARESSTNKFILKWKVCENIASNYDGFYHNTDYSVVEITTEYFNLNTHQVVQTLDTTFVSQADSAFLPRKFHPEFTSIDSSEIKINTRAFIRNIEGPLPDEKRYLPYKNLNILLYTESYFIGSVRIES